MYNKIFTKILDSSIWLEPSGTRLVWLTLIAAMDEDGFCQFASVSNLAYRARVDKPEAESAIACLEGPDADSSDPDNEGRRIERVPGGWVVLNAAKYRDLVTRAISKEQTRIRVARFREKKREGSVVKRTSNAPVTQSEAATDSISSSPKKENEKVQKKSPTTENSSHGEFIHLWTEEYPKHHDGSEYAFNGGRDGKAVKELLQSSKLTPLELVDFAVEAWERPSAFHCKSAASIAGFARQFNDIRHELRTSLLPVKKDDRPASYREPMNAPPEPPPHIRALQQ